MDLRLLRICFGFKKEIRSKGYAKRFEELIKCFYNSKKEKGALESKVLK